MGRSFLVAGAILVCATMGVVSPANAGAREDAAYIASVLLSDEVMATQVNASGDLMVPFMLKTFADEGVILSDASAKVFTDIFLDEFAKVFGDEMRQVFAKAYLLNLSAEELADTRAFLETDSGKAWASVQPEITTDALALGSQAGRRAGQLVVQPVLNRLEAQEGAVFTEDELAGLKKVLE